MELIDFLKSNESAQAAAASGDFAAAAAMAAAYETQRVDRTPRTTSWLSRTFTDPVGDAGLTEADVVLATLQAATIPRVKAAYQTMTVSGLDFADAAVQSMLPQLAVAGGWPDGLADRLAAFGVAMMRPFADVTGDECRAVWIAEESRQNLETIRQRRQLFDQVQQSVRQQISNGTLTLPAAIGAAIAAGMEA